MRAFKRYGTFPVRVNLETADNDTSCDHVVKSSCNELDQARYLGVLRAHNHKLQTTTEDLIILFRAWQVEKIAHQQCPAPSDPLRLRHTVTDRGSACSFQN
ncbi:uncharacterized protein EKO05_0009095 [Ascochyta rabiei]|uniref:uncharacterized protein n=1 Tax=Didymella rabiei TaxID=5454 RepID=UPI0021FD54D5|nr:uncharacterized protein EKO05_0009095 [Ascochyta rabiei]UPX18805.1 hypothetical protein EKO05_0009095 [Ascochyta rabiei]